LIQKTEDQKKNDFVELIETRKKMGIDPVFNIAEEFSMGFSVGQGSFATVYRSTHKDTGLEVALKTYEKKLLNNRSQLTAIHREIYILAGMRHPNIMKLFEVLDTPSKCHLVLELCKGRNLYNYIKKRPFQCLSETDAAPIFRQIVSSIAYMHDLGLVHRDLKLEHILINDSSKMNEIKIIDFGFAVNCKANEKL